MTGSTFPVATDIHRAVEIFWRDESAKIIARMTRLVGDLGQAEDVAQEAFVAALEQWPVSGIPRNPTAWLMAIARRRAIDTLRRRTTAQQKAPILAQEITGRADIAEEVVGALDDQIGDDVLRLMFMCCHPVLPTEARVALTLRVLGGLTTEEIARAFLMPVATVAQRIVRAKKTLNEARVAFELPRADEIDERLNSVLEVIYLIFNEGYTATSGEEWLRPALCEEAMRLGRLLTAIAPAEAEVHGLAALMDMQASRQRARTDAQGEPVLLLDQDRSLWDRRLINRGAASLEKAAALAGGRGRYALQAAIAACHAHAATNEDTDWQGIADLYAQLNQVTPSPVVELHRAVAISMAAGAEAGLEIVDRLMDEPILASYHMLPSIRGDLLARLGRPDEARAEFRRAAAMTRNQRERALLLRRAGD